MRVKEVIDWSLPTLPDKEIPQKTRKILGLIGSYWLPALLGGKAKEIPAGVNPGLKEIILRCKGEGELPPYQIFTELYEAIKKLS